jgi:hypothetical protein
VKDGFKYVFKRKEYLKERQAEDNKVISPAKDIEHLEKHLELIRLFEKKKTAFEKNISEADKLIIQQRPDNDPEKAFLLSLPEAEKASAENRRILEATMERLRMLQLKVIYNECSDGPKALTGQKFLKAEDISKLEKFRLN